MGKNIILPIGLATAMFVHEVECTHISIQKTECGNKHIEVETRANNYPSFDKGIAVASGTEVSTIDTKQSNNRDMY